MATRASRRAFVACCLLAALAPWLGGAASREPAPAPFPGWASYLPAGFHETALSRQEHAFAEGFPGRIARFSDGRQALILRWIAEPSRRLHPAEHCLRGAGFTLTPTTPSPRVRKGASAWIAERNGKRVLVHEWIEASDGHVFGSVGAWYWPSTLGHSPGPWVAYTLSETISP